MTRTKQIKIPQDTDSIIEEIEYKIENKMEHNPITSLTIQLTFIQHLRYTSIFTDSNQNGIEIPTKEEFLQLKPGDIIKINIYI